MPEPALRISMIVIEHMLTYSDLDSDLERKVDASEECQCPVFDLERSDACVKSYFEYP